MAWIDVVPSERATGALKELYDKFKVESGPIFTPYEVMTLNGPALQALEAFQHVVRFEESPLTRTQREYIATLVSGLADCVF